MVQSNNFETGSHPDATHLNVCSSYSLVRVVSTSNRCDLVSIDVCLHASIVNVHTETSSKIRIHVRIDISLNRCRSLAVVGRADAGRIHVYISLHLRDLVKTLVVLVNINIHACVYICLNTWNHIVSVYISIESHSRSLHLNIKTISLDLA